MIEKSVGAIKWLEFELFQDFKSLRHAIFLRDGGKSKAPYTSLNLGLSTDDACAGQNLDKAFEVLQVYDYKKGSYVHGSSILLAEESENLFCDGLATQKEELALMVTHADCQAAILFDPVTRSIANIHAGWRGQVDNIYKNAVKFLKKCFNVKVENLFAAVSPSLGPGHAEFKGYEAYFPKSFYKFKKENCHFDLWSLAEAQFLELGILPGHLQIARKCTFEEKDQFFSHRRDKITGRNATFVVLSKKSERFP